MSLSNAWGLFMVIFLLGFGLVAIPQNLFRLADYHRRIKYLEWQAGNDKENLINKLDEIHIVKMVFLIIFLMIITQKKLSEANYGSNFNITQIEKNEDEKVNLDFTFYRKIHTTRILKRKQFILRRICYMIRVRKLYLKGR